MAMPAPSMTSAGAQLVGFGAKSAHRPGSIQVRRSKRRRCSW